MKNRSIKILSLFIVFTVLMTAGFGCKGGSKKAQQAFKRVDLTYWRVFDDEDYFRDLIGSYSALHPNVRVEYRKLRYDEYKDELLNAFAEDRGPDIFSIHNSWIGEYIPKLTPAPPTVTLPYPIIKGTIKKEREIVLRTSKGVTIPYVLNNFVDQVAYDVIWEEKKSGKEYVFGLPLAMDTLVLFSNKDLLNNAGIPQAPKSWSDFQTAVKKVVRLDSEGNLLLAGAAIGTSENVERSSDIVSLLMMQNGTIMETVDRDIKFNEMPEALKGKRVVLPGEEALRFYTDFASPVKEVYTWDKSMPNSLDAFISGRVAFFFGYSYHLPIIKNRAPKLNLGISKAPQISGNEEINFANYFLEVVSKKSSHKAEAWDFIKHITSKKAVTSYLEQAKKPTALRELVLGQVDDVDLGPFASQVLTAKSWYKGYDALASEKIMEELIDSTIKGDQKLRNLLGNAAEKVEQTTYSRKKDL